MQTDLANSLVCARRWHVKGRTRVKCPRQAVHKEEKKDLKSLTVCKSCGKLDNHSKPKLMKAYV